MGISIKANTAKESSMDSGNSFGKMGNIIKDTSAKDSAVGMGFGRADRESVINTKGSLKITKKTDMEYTLGLAAIYTKETIKIT
jgi:hypothetical protein